MQRSSRVGRSATPAVPASTLSLAATFVAVLVAVSTGSATAATTGRSSVAMQPTQELAILLRLQTARSAPGKRSFAVSVVSAQRPITGERTVLPVIGHRSVGGVAWLHVRLPGRPNGLTGWITRGGTSATRTSWHIVVDTSKRRVTVFKNGRAVREFPAVVGKPSTPTPTGQFFVEETVELGAGAVGAPFALALSARSNVLQEFAGGPGQIALHGLDNVGGVLGTAASHGCVRLADDTMRWLSTRIGPGFPVTIQN
jgi:lipoprotein-anchoring transpeptidase ErfK/SrfK